MESKKLEISELYEELRDNFGFLNWWPGETPDEIIIGAILTQQTSWRNVEKALENLRHAKALELRKISGLGQQRLEKLIRPSGFYRQKARRLKALARHIYNNYPSVGKFLNKDTGELRKELLEQNGVGKETADSILLYAAGKKVFVIDAYTKRIMHRVYGTEEGIKYDELQERVSGAIKSDLRLYKDLHAQLVRLGKEYCNTRPRCNSCPIRGRCNYFKTLCNQGESSG